MTPPAGPSADRLRAAAAGTRVPAAVTEAWNTPPPDPGPGQIWRARWNARHHLVLLQSVTGTQATAAPISLEVGLADDTTVILAAADTTVGMPLVMWSELAQPLPIRVLDRLAGHVTGSGRNLLDPRSETADRPRGERVVSPVDPRAEYRAMLEDAMADFAAARWAPTGSGTLANLLREVGLGPADLADALDVAPQQALALLRGTMPLTDDQAAALSATARRPAKQLLDANPPLPDELVARLDLPARRAYVVQVAQQRGLSEERAWQVVGYDVFALAARQTGPSRSIAWDERIDRYFTVVLG